jgi:hypothetical protein
MSDIDTHLILPVMYDTTVGPWGEPCWVGATHWDKNNHKNELDTASSPKTLRHWVYGSFHLNVAQPQLLHPMGDINSVDISQHIPLSVRLSTSTIQRDSLIAPPSS